MEGQYFISPAAAFVLLSGAMVREVPLMVAHGPETLATLRAEWPFFALSIALGTSINYLQFMLIQVLLLGSACAIPLFPIVLDILHCSLCLPQELGGVALKVMSTVRNVLIVAHSALFRGEAVTGREVAGCAQFDSFSTFVYGMKDCFESIL